jgi:hypothetical protein
MKRKKGKDPLLNILELPLPNIPELDAAIDQFVRALTDRVQHSMHAWVAVI